MVTENVAQKSVPKAEATQRNGKRSYRFGFVLTTAAGNMTRYLNLRKYAERDPEVECIWAPVKHYLEPNPFRHLPGPLQTRAIVMEEASPVMRQYSTFDAIMFHAFEPFVQSVFRSSTTSLPLTVWSADNAPLPPGPTPDRAGSRHPIYGDNHARSQWRRALRFQFDLWCLRRVPLFFPFSAWAGEVLQYDCGVPTERIHPINVGLDLELWPYLPKEEAPIKRPQILFVGGNFKRKGGDMLLAAYRERFASHSDLHLVTQEPPAEGTPPGVTVHTGLKPNDERLRHLYAQCDLFVLPTQADVSSWVAMEAMATGRPVISTRVGGIPDIVRDGTTGFLIEPNDKETLIQRMDQLLSDATLRQRMGVEGRRIIEAQFNASICVPKILGIMKQSVDALRKN